jgi:hypothetical protein
MVFYWVLTWLLYPAFFAFEQVDAGMISLALYYLSCALISSLAIVYIFYSVIFTSCHSSSYQKATALVLLLITIDNVIMAADAITNPYVNKTLDFVDTIIQGSSDWFVPIGLSDILLIVILIKCLLYSLQRQECR